jgi:predicted enzyme related to lactoylglutathione lyase
MTSMKQTTAPAIFRVLVPAKNLRETQRFYEALLEVAGRQVAEGRVYFDCGPVILGILEYSSVAGALAPPTEALYFATIDLEGMHRRARELGALSTELIHDDPASPAGEILVRPWGERSFYAFDPSGNPLCFVDSGTVFTGTPEQIAALERGSP